MINIILYLILFILIIALSIAIKILLMVQYNKYDGEENEFTLPIKDNLFFITSVTRIDEKRSKIKIGFIEIEE